MDERLIAGSRGVNAWYRGWTCNRSFIAVAIVSALNLMSDALGESVFNECQSCRQLFDEWISKHEFYDTQNAEYIAMSAHHDLCMEHQQWRRRYVGRWILAPELLEKEYAEIDARIKMIEELT